MRKRTIAAIIACILGIVLLAALAFIIPGLLNGGNDPLYNLLHPGTPQKESDIEEFGGFIYSTEKDAAITTAQTESESRAQTESEYDSAEEETLSALPAGIVKEHRIIFVGDSRTLGMRDALRRSSRRDDDVFVGRVGEGVHWFIEEGMDEMSDAIEENPDLPVVLNLGVNDPLEIDDYIVTYWDCIREHPDTDFYIMSVNPIDEEFLLESETAVEEVLDTINNLNIAKLNIALKEEFASRYLDCAAWLKENGFDTVDGLHFSTSTYLKVHDFAVNELF